MCDAWWEQQGVIHRCADYETPHRGRAHRCACHARVNPYAKVRKDHCPFTIGPAHGGNHRGS